MKILIIDDSRDITDLLVKVLTAIGHQVSAATSGREGLELVKTGNFDIVFLDIAMPDFSGLDVINELVKVDQLRKSLVVLFTASSITDAEVEKLVELGVHSCLRKPVQIDTLFAKVNELEKIRNLQKTNKS